MPTKQVFKTGNSSAVTGGTERVLDYLAAMPRDMFPKKRKDPKPQRRKGL
jgi:hypothetical protein